MEENNTSPVNEMIRNAELRTQIEPFTDESVTRVDIRRWPLHKENQFLEQMLGWEKAPVLPIARWFAPELSPPPASSLSDAELARELSGLVQKLYEKKIVLDFTDHLSDRELYNVIVRKILPTEVKMTDNQGGCRHWNCACIGDREVDRETWLTYYASDEERRIEADRSSEPLPERILPLYPRTLPGEIGFYNNL